VAEGRCVSAKEKIPPEVAEQLKKFDKNGVESVDALISYAKHVEKRNEELFECMNKLKEDMNRYIAGLVKIREACRGCPAYYIAMEALDGAGGDDVPDNEGGI